MTENEVIEYKSCEYADYITVSTAFKEKWNVTVTPTTNFQDTHNADYSNFDVILTKTSGEKSEAEIKARYVSISDYEDAVIEVEKVEKMNNGVIINLYIQDNKIAVWKTRDSHKWQQIKMPAKRKTLSDQRKVVKDFYCMPIADAYVFDFDLKKHEKLKNFYKRTIMEFNDIMSE